MSLQQERIHALCEQLRLPGIASGWSGHAQAAAAQDGGYADFLEAVLRTEMAARQERTRQTLLKLATLPTVKTIEQFDFGFASGVSKAQVMDLAGLAFLERQENVVLLGPSGVPAPLYTSNTSTHGSPQDPARGVDGWGGGMVGAHANPLHKRARGPAQRAGGPVQVW